MVSEFVGTAYKILCRIHVCKPYVIVRVDGGICSQMNQYLLGQIYAERGEKVGYDLSWYKKNGMDVDRCHVREYELEKMFPGIRIQSCDGLKTWFYRMFLMYSTEEQKLPRELESGKIAPIYLGGYYRIDDAVFCEQFERLFSDLNRATVNYELSTSYPNQHKCAVHVRRGDLARGDNPWYGGVTDDYFFRAISYVEEHHPNTRFFFFSDEMDYVEKNLVPNLKVDYQMVKEHHKGYEDLLLISICDTIVASQGSFGKYAAMLNKDSMLILQDDEFAKPWLLRKKVSLAL